VAIFPADRSSFFADEPIQQYNNIRRLLRGVEGGSPRRREAKRFCVIQLQPMVRTENHGPPFAASGRGIGTPEVEVINSKINR
jgi:hypothetical protein